MIRWALLCATAAFDDTDDACGVEQRGGAAIRAVRHGRVADRAEARVGSKLVTAYKKRRPPIGRDGEFLCHAFYDLEVKVRGGAQPRSRPTRRSGSARAKASEAEEGRERARESENSGDNARRRFRRLLY